MDSMSCPDAKTLSEFSDGDLSDPSVRKHVKACEACQGVLGTESRLRSAFGRLTCPAPEELGLFIDDALDAERLERIAGHVLECGDCRDVVSWTREAQVHVAKSNTRRRRRPRGASRSGDQTLTWVGAAVAIAAAILVIVVLGGRPDQRPSDQAELPPVPTPIETPTPDRDQPPEVPDVPEDGATDPLPTPDVPVPDDDPSGEPPVRPEPTVTPEPTPDSPDADATETPNESGTSETERPAPAPISVMALASADLTWRHADGPSAGLRGPASIPAGSLLEAGRGGSVRIGGATCALQARASVTVAENAIELISGDVLLDANEGDQAVACGDALVRPERGARLFLSREKTGSFLLCMVTGNAELSLQGQAALSLRAGEARRVRGGRVRAVRKPAAVLARARAVVTETALQSGVDVPRGLTALRSLRAATALLGGTLSERARAALALEALRAADPRLAALAALESGPASDLGSLAKDPEALAQEGGAGATILALLCRNQGKRLDAEARDVVQALAQALAGLTPEAISSEPGAILSLRAAERATKARLPRSTWKAIASAIELDSPYRLGAALLAKKPVDAATRARLLAELDGLLQGSTPPDTAAALWQLEQALVLTDTLNADRDAQLVAHAARLGSSPLIVPLLAHSSTLLLGAKRLQASGPASVVTQRVGDTYHVTFAFRSARRPRKVYLCGSWDNWLEEQTLMTKRPDGSFTATIALAPGDHEYKLRLVSGDTDVWEIDAQNPLSGPNGRGSLNSLLPLGE
jgi:hypothetical protein